MTNVGKDVGNREKRSLYIVGGNVDPLWKSVWRLFKNLKLEISFDPAILYLDVLKMLNVSH